MKAIKVILWIVMLLVVLSVGLVLVATNLIDPNEYKPKVAQLVEDKTGRKLDMQGDLELTFFPWIGVETGKLSLSNAAGFSKAPMVSVENAKVKVKLLPLLKKQVEVDTVVLDSPVVRLQTLADGLTNWDDLVSASGAKSVPDEPATQSAGAIAGLAVQGVSINDGHVEWQNDQANQSLTLKNLNLSTGSLVPGQPLDISLSVDASGNMIPEPAVIKLDTTLTLAKNMASVNLAGTALNVAMESIQADLSVDKIAYALEAGLAAINGLSGKLEKGDVQSTISVSSVNFNLSDETLEVPSVSLNQEDVSITAGVSAAGLLSNPVASGSFDIKAGDVRGFLAENGIKIELTDLDLKQLNTKGNFDYKNNAIKLEGFDFAALVNSHQTNIKAQTLGYDINSHSLQAPSLQIDQGDFTFRGGLDGKQLLSNDRQLDGQIDVAIADIKELVARNGLKIDLPDIPLQNIKLNTRIEVAGNDVSADALLARFDHHQQATEVSIPSVSINLESGALDLPSSSIKQGDFALDASAKGSGVTGDLAKMDVAGNVKVSAADVPGLLSRNVIPVEIPHGLVTSFGINTAFKLANNNATLGKLDAKIDDMTLKGNVELINLDKPSYKFDLVINKLDVDKLVSGDGEASSEAKPSTSEQILLPVAPLQGLNVDGRAKIGTLITTGLTLSDVDITIKSDKDVLRIVPMTAKVFGGSIDAQLSYDVSGNEPDVRLVSKVNKVDVGALLQALEITEKITGTGNLSTNLSGQGADTDQMIASLDGDIDFRLLNGAIRGYDLQATLISLEKQFSQLQGGESTTQASPAAETKFAELSGSFKVKNGVFRNDDLDMKAPLFRLGGRGAMDLPQSRIDYKLDVNVVESVEGQGGKSLQDLKGERVPLKIYGSLNDPTFTLDLAEVLKDQAKKELKKKLLEQIAPDGIESLEQGDESTAPPANTEDAIKQELKKKLKEGLLKGLGLG